MSECIHHYRRDVESCPYCELIEAEAEVRRLREALRRYGRHDCPYPLTDCDCGLVAALEGTED